MAIWQFEVALQADSTITGQAAEGRNRFGPEPQDLFRQSDADIVRRIDGFLSRRISWAEGLLLWGEENGDRIDAVLEKGKIVELTARIDLRHPPGDFLTKLVELAKDCGARFQTADDQAILAEVHRVLDAIRHSASYRFALDPRRYFPQPEDE